MIGSIHPAAKCLQAIRLRHGLVCLALALALSAWAQQNTGSLSGVVIGPNGMPVAGAAVTATHDATGQEVRTETGPFGLYLFPGLEVGMYTVTVTAPGFQTATVTGQPVEVATRSVLDVFLQPGGSGQTSQISATGAVLEESSADLGTFFSQKLLTDLPIFVRGGIRDPQSLVTYAPTVRNGGTESSINGGPLLSKEILLDGSSHTSPEAGGVSLAFPAPEQFSEFRVLTSAYGAEYGRTGGGIEAWVPRRGGNRIHGSLFDFLRNDKFDAAGWAVNSNGAEKSKVRQNQYGLDLGGPVSIPDVYDGRGKSFFHFSFNGYKQNTLSRDELITIPTLPMRGGDFSRVTDSSGQRILIYDPATTTDRGQGTVRDPFNGNQIPVARFSSVSRRMLNFLPEPTNNNLENNYLASNNVALTRYMWSVKFDQLLSPTKRISGFASMQHLNTLSEGPLPDELSDGNLQYFRPENYRFNYVSTTGPSTVKHFTFGFTQYERTFDRLQAQRQDWAEELGLAGIEQGEASSFPVVTFANNLVPFARASDYAVRGGEITDLFELRYDVSMARGVHNFKAGLDFRYGRLHQDPRVDFGVQGVFNFSNFQTAQAGAALPATGHSFASFLLGLPDNAFRVINSQPPDLNYRYHALYVQDEIRLGSRLTMNVGLRYDLPLSRIDTDGVLSAFDPNLPNPEAGGLNGALAYSGKGTGRTGRRRFGELDKKQFGPRIGLAYLLTENTVLRAGFGIHYSGGNGSMLGGCTLCALGSSAVIERTSNGFDPALSWDDGLTPQAGLRRPPVIDPSFANGGPVYFLGSDEGKAPRFRNWSLSLQRELPGRFVVDVAYSGMRASRLSGPYPMNQLDPQHLALGDLLRLSINDPRVTAAGFSRPYPSFTGTLAQALRPYPQYLDISDLFSPRYEADFHALIVKAEKRYSFLTLLANYTWSKATATVSSSQAATETMAPQDAYNLANEHGLQLFDIPHAFNLVYTIDLPLGRNSQSSLLRGILGGWTVAATHQYRSGTLLSVNAPNTLGQGVLFSARTRPNVTGNAFRTSAGADSLDPNNPQSRWLDPDAFAVPAPYTLGNAANFYNEVRNPSFFSENLSIVKRIPVMEMLHVEYRLDIWNLFNRTLFGNINTDLSSPGFGLATGSMLAPRFVQMGLRLSF